MSASPPNDIKPEALFRLLLLRPRPRWKLAWRASSAPGIALYARGLSGMELGLIVDAFDGLEPRALRESRMQCELLARAVVLECGRQAFRDGFELASLLNEREAVAIEDDATRALAIVSPVYSSIDVSAWNRVLVAGASHARNLHAAITLGRCVDVSYGPRCREVLPRPDRFFGVEQAELTDGQWLAFRAARAVVTKMESQ